MQIPGALSRFFGSAKSANCQRVVTKAQAIARVQRRLAKDGQVLKSCRDASRLASSLGNLYIVDSDDFVVAAHCSVRRLAADLEILGDGEVLAEDVA